ncbi:hypothetical protein C8Q75DRAFT_809830 [Abortiporus biennis]|nr:hypothetical protein C8Q75DRAFT_809830 [Abortiporus biennis]
MIILSELQNSTKHLKPPEDLWQRLVLNNANVESCYTDSENSNIIYQLTGNTLKKIIDDAFLTGQNNGATSDTEVDNSSNSRPPGVLPPSRILVDCGMQTDAVSVFSRQRIPTEASKVTSLKTGPSRKIGKSQSLPHSHTISTSSVDTPLHRKRSLPQEIFEEIIDIIGASYRDTVLVDNLSDEYLNPRLIARSRYNIYHAIDTVRSSMRHYGGSTHALDTLQNNPTIRDITMNDARKHRCSTILNARASVLVVLLVTLAGTPIYAYFLQALHEYHQTHSVWESLVFNLAILQFLSTSVPQTTTCPAPFGEVIIDMHTYLATEPGEYPGLFLASAMVVEYRRHP